MKKIISLILIFLMSFSASYAQNDIKIYYDSSELVTSAPIIVDSGRTYLPLRDFFESIGGDVSWNSSTKGITITKDSKVINLMIDSNTSYVNEVPVYSDTTPKIVNDLTYIPLRFLSESIGIEVYWNDYYRNIYLIENLSEFNDESNIYKGEFLDDKPHGFVKKYDLSRNLKYEGYYINGLRSGIGTQYWSNGDIYHGNFTDDNINGEGKMIYKDKGLYRGSFKDGKRNGKGIFTWINGETYEGEWKDDMMNGIGTYIFSNEDKYIGNWTDNKMNGEGNYHFISGQVYIGNWNNGEYVGGVRND